MNDETIDNLYSNYIRKINNECEKLEKCYDVSNNEYNELKKKIKKKEIITS